MISASPLGTAFLTILEKLPFALKIDGISTELTPGRGYKDLAEATYLSWLAWHSLYLRCGVGKRGLPVGRA